MIKSKLCHAFSFPCHFHYDKGAFIVSKSSTIGWWSGYLTEFYTSQVYLIGIQLFKNKMKGISISISISSSWSYLLRHLRKLIWLLNAYPRKWLSPLDHFLKCYESKKDGRWCRRWKHQESDLTSSQQVNIPLRATPFLFSWYYLQVSAQPNWGWRQAR